MFLGCMDQDPFRLAERRIVGEYRLNQWEDGNYYLVTPATRHAPGGAIEGTVAQIAWTAHEIVIRSKPLVGDSTWLLIDVATGAVQRSTSAPSLTRAVALRPAAEAWTELK